MHTWRENRALLSSFMYYVLSHNAHVFIGYCRSVLMQRDRTEMEVVTSYVGVCASTHACAVGLPNTRVSE